MLFLFCFVSFCSVLFGVCFVLFCFAAACWGRADNPSATQKIKKRRKKAEILLTAKEIAPLIQPGPILSSKLFSIFAKNRN